MFLAPAFAPTMPNYAPLNDSISAEPISEDGFFFHLGEPDLDHHHGRLLHCLKQLVSVNNSKRGKESVAAAAGDLFETWIAHCNAEKELMQNSGWWEAARHLADHNRLTLSLSNLLYRHVQDDRDAKLEQMATFFICYLVEHLHRFDRPLAEYLLERRQQETDQAGFGGEGEAES